MSGFIITAALPQHILDTLSHVVVDNVDLDFIEWGGVHGEMATKRLADAGIANLSEWEIIGHKYVDHSGWCDFEQKMEYYGEDLRLLVRKADLFAAKAAYLSRRELLQHRPFSAMSA